LQFSPIYGKIPKREGKHLAETTHEKKKTIILDKIRIMRLLDDAFMTKCFEGNSKCVELLLHIILGKPDLIVKSATTQYGIKNLQGRSVRLDIYAVDSSGKEYNIEVERGDKVDKVKKVRYNSSLMDANSILPGDDVSLLPETYVIMIMEDDFWGQGEPIYPIERYVGKTGIVYDDGAHLIYVNAAYKEEVQDLTPLGKLIHDFNCVNAGDMYYPALAERVRYFKEDVKGVGIMCRAVEELAEELFAENKKESALKIIRSGKLTLEEISEYIGLPIDEVEALANGA
jgi:hypothetical protein